MATTIDSVIQNPITKPHRNRATLALAVGIVVAGLTATTAVLVDGHDGSSPAPREQVTTEATPTEDPLVTRYGQHSSTPYNDDGAQDRQLRLSLNR